MNDIFKALADPTRREILRALRGGERTAGELAELSQLSKSTLSGHFAVLRAAGLVQSEKRGTHVVYRLNTTVFQDALTELSDLLHPLAEMQTGTQSAPRQPVRGEAKG